MESKGVDQGAEQTRSMPIWACDASAGSLKAESKTYPVSFTTTTMSNTTDTNLLTSFDIDAEDAARKALIPT
jgi:hypothetical protein